MKLRTKCAAEFFGTFWLVLGGCGSAVLAANFPGAGIGFLGVALAFGLSVLTAAYAIGNISGAHLNPAVSIGLALAGRLPKSHLLAYIVSQLLGSLIGAAVLFAIASGNPDFHIVSGFAANGYGVHSPGGYSLGSVIVTECILTFAFVFIILGVTDERAPKGLAPLAIGLTLTVIHLISIPVSNTSVNPARSTSQAIFVGGWALQQLFVFWVAPILGASLAGATYPKIFSRSEDGDVGQ